jgi:protein phosphatase
MSIAIPELSLVVLIGASGSGKSTFARQHFLPTEIISSDYCRGLVADDENDQSASKDAFEVLHYIAAKRLAAGRLTVVDATNVQVEARKHLLRLARQYHVIPVALVLNLPEAVCQERNRQRPDRQFGDHVIPRHIRNLRQSLRGLEREGFRQVHILSSEAEIQAVAIERQPLWNNRKTEHGPFDIIGDVHGCADELQQLLEQLGYQSTTLSQSHGFWDFPTYRHPENRKVIFLGDLVDRGPRILDCLKLVRNMLAADSAICVPGNHDMKLLRHLKGNQVKINHGLEQSIAEVDALPEAGKAGAIEQLCQFLDDLVSHYVLDDGKLVVAHAGMKEELQGRGSGKVRDFALYGESTGEIDDFGLPVRHNWAAEYRGKAMVVYGHTPIPTPEWLNNTIDIDTGCVFGGQLTALRYPEKDLVSVPAARVYCEPVKPLQPTPVNTLSAQQNYDDVLDMADLIGKRLIFTNLQKKITIREENGIAALEALSRFAANPKWLIYLPPTMSPVTTSTVPGFLEYPTEALDYYGRAGVSQVVCEEKHMGSRAVVVICRDETVAARRFGVVNEGIGICYTRMGRRFFDDRQLESEMLTVINNALTQSGFWEDLQTDWVCLDCELMPWSAKAQGLLRQQYAAVGTAAHHALQGATALLQQATARGVKLDGLLEQYQGKQELADRYIDAYRRYCWTVDGLSDFKLAPFHILATEGAVHRDKTHRWHMEAIARICQAAPELLLATHYQVVDLEDVQSRNQAIQWWEELTAKGGEGMVVKPMEFLTYSGQNLLQPAVKCRGAEYLRIIYGPEYSLPQNLQRLRQRGLGLKRSLALREFALGMESLDRFVAQLPLRQVHECVFGVLALESEPVDPRL